MTGQSAIEKAINELQKAALLVSRVALVAREQERDGATAVDALKRAIALLRGTVR
jgi:hypothetical protein